MTSYAKRTGRRPDFRVRYRWIEDQAPEFHQKPFQHMRCDFSYEGDDVARDGIYMVWPEFESVDGAVLPEGSPIPREGVASMWIVVPEMRARVHQPKARVGVRGFFMVGGTRIAEAEIIEIVGLTDREYRAIIWTSDVPQPGRRVTVHARDLDEAREKLEGQYGEGTVFDLHNEEDASRPR